jgi:hypothetical protein
VSALAADFHPDYYDRQEALAEWRALQGEPEPWDDSFWAGVISAPAYTPPEKECEF